MDFSTFIEKDAHGSFHSNEVVFAKDDKCIADTVLRYGQLSVDFESVIVDLGLLLRIVDNVANDRLTSFTRASSGYKPIDRRAPEIRLDAGRCFFETFSYSRAVPEIGGRPPNN